MYVCTYKKLHTCIWLCIYKLHIYIKEGQENLGQSGKQSLAPLRKAVPCLGGGHGTPHSPTLPPPSHPRRQNCYKRPAGEAPKSLQNIQTASGGLRLQGLPPRQELFVPLLFSSLQQVLLTLLQSVTDFTAPRMTICFPSGPSGSLLPQWGGRGVSPPQISVTLSVASVSRGSLQDIQLILRPME